MAGWEAGTNDPRETLVPVNGGRHADSPIADPVDMGSDFRADLLGYHLNPVASTVQSCGEGSFGGDSRDFDY